MCLGKPRLILSLNVRHKSFPTINVPASLLNTGAHEIPLLILAMFFVEAVVGEFAIAMRLVILPSALMSAGMAPVFYQRASKAYQKYGHTRDVTIPSLRGLTYLALPCFLVLAISAPWAFIPIFGEGWDQAGIYVAVLSPLCFFMFIASPVSQLYFVLGKQKVFFTLHLTYFLSAAAAFTIAGLTHDPLTGVVLFSAMGSIRFLAMLLYICRADGISIGEVLSIRGKKHSL